LDHKRTLLVKNFPAEKRQHEDGVRKHPRPERTVSCDCRKRREEAESCVEGEGTFENQWKGPVHAILTENPLLLWEEGEQLYTVRIPSLKDRTLSRERY